MKVECVHKIIPIDENFDAAVKQLQADGFRTIDGMVPVAIFPVVRAVGEAAPLVDSSTKLDLTIDDSKVMVIRAGETKQ